MVFDERAGRVAANAFERGCCGAALTHSAPKRSEAHAEAHCEGDDRPWSGNPSGGTASTLSSSQKETRPSAARSGNVTALPSRALTSA